MVEKVLTAKAVGREFVRQYYTMLNKQPKFLHRFYGTNSEMIHGDFNVQTPIVGQVKIREHIRELKFEDCYTKVACLDAFLTIGNGIVVQVVGEISNNAAPLRRFAQTFVLGPQERQGVEAGTSFYIHNDIFRYQEEVYEEIVPEKTEHVIEPTQNGISHHHDLQAHGDAPEPELIQNNFAEPEPVVEVAQPEPVAEPVANGFEEHPSIKQIMNDYSSPSLEPTPVVSAPVEPVQEPVEAPVVEPEPVIAEPEPVKEPEPVAPAPEPVKVAEAPVQPPKPAGPISWAARMRGGAAAAAPAPVPVQAPKPVAVKPVEPKPEPVKVQEPEPEAEQRDQGRREFSDRPRYNDSCQIFVGALPRNMTEEDIKGVFEEFGEVQHIRINQGNRSDSKNGFGFVTFKSEESVKNALEKKHNIMFNGYQLNIEEKKVRADNRGGYREGGRGGFRGGRGGNYNGQREQNRGAPRGPREFNGEGGGYRNRDNRGAPRNNKQF